MGKKKRRPVLITGATGFLGRHLTEQLSAAGDTEAYQFYLGKVYYWLGRPAEGRALFDMLLTEYERQFATLMTVAHTLREVGAYLRAKEARHVVVESGLTEEALVRRLLAMGILR